MNNHTLPSPVLSRALAAPEPEAARDPTRDSRNGGPLPGFGLIASTPAGDAAGPHLARALALADEDLVRRFEAGVPAPALVRQRAEFMDRLVVRLWTQVFAQSAFDHALVAVGGYGRGELHPASDIDLMVLLGEPANARTEDMIRTFLQTLWDLKLDVGASVRTVEQCVEESLKDVSVVTTLMESRRLSGSQTLFARLRSRTGRDAIWPCRDFFEAKLAEQRARHARYHDTANNLEPNVKEGPGGLRDVQMVGWVAKRHFGATTLDELVSHGFLTPGELALLVEGQDFLWSVRFALHALSHRREDRLVFDMQRRIAEVFGYVDDDANLAVEKFMKRYYRTAMALSRLNELLLELFQEAILAENEPLAVERVNGRFRTVNGALEVAHAKTFEQRPFAMLELFLILQQREDIEGVRASTIRLVRDNLHLIDDRFRADLRARSLFIEILRQPRGINHGLRRMHRYGVLGAYLPVFGDITGQMQYDLFHAYTVDEHTLFVVRNLRAFSDPKRKHEFPLASRIAATLPKPELLYIAGLFHDIAKGRGGDHSELGAADAESFCRLHGFGEYDTRIVSWLVKHHLLMSVTAQRRDISDPEVVAKFARTVGDKNHLDYLYLLTVADIRGTNPNLWNDWKGQLLENLYRSTAYAFARGLATPVDREGMIASTQREAREQLADAGVPAARAESLWDSLGADYFARYTADEIAWHTAAILDAPLDALPLVMARRSSGGHELFVYAADQKHLFAATTSALGRAGLNIVQARIITADNGMTLDSYLVIDMRADSGEPPLDHPERIASVRESIRAGLRSDQAPRVPGGDLSHRRLAPFDTPVDVKLSPDPDAARTILEVSAADRPGLLGRIGWALAECEVRLQTAKIATFGERADDVFYVTDAHNLPLAQARFEMVRARIVRAIEEG